MRIRSRVRTLEGSLGARAHWLQSSIRNMANLRNVTMFFLVCWITQLFSGGVIQGWPGLQDILEDEGAFANLDPDAKETAFERIPTLGFLALSAASVVFGLMLDSVGPRVVATLGCLVMTGGNLLLAFSPSDEWLAWAVFCISFGGIGPYLSNITFAVQCTFLSNCPQL